MNTKVPWIADLCYFLIKDREINLTTKASANIKECCLTKRKVKEVAYQVIYSNENDGVILKIKEILKRNY